VKKENLLNAGAVAIIIAALSSGAQAADAQPATKAMEPVVVRASAYAVSRPVSELAREQAGATNAPSQPARMQPLRRLPKTIRPADALRVWKFTVDWVTPANSTFGLSGLPDYVLPVAAFDQSFSAENVIPQPGTAVKLDVIADRLLYRLQYRNFGAYETLVANHTVDAGVDHAGVRFYELRRTLPAGTWAVYQQGTFAPDGENRWMGSAAMDGAGNLAIGYSVSSASVYPSIRYAGRLASDPTNTMAQGEATMTAGSGSQTSSAGRWGDYSMLAVDPVDDSTFWYVNQYYLTTSSSSWRTRIGTFAFVPEPLALLPMLAVALALLRRSAA